MKKEEKRNNNEIPISKFKILEIPNKKLFLDPAQLLI